MGEKEIVYLLTNPAMPGLLKIGHTTQSDVTERMKQLYSVGVPVPFDCVYAVEVADCKRVEAAFHTAFDPHRVNKSREFFKMEAEQAIVILKLLNGKDVTPGVTKQLNSNIAAADLAAAEKMKKRKKMNFEKMQIAIGETIIFRDGETTATVAENNKVKFKNEVVSLTAATRSVMGLENDYPIQPSPYWTYKGRTLKEIYDETYSEE